MMKNNIKLIAILLLVACLSLSQFTACVSINNPTSTPSTFWNVNQYGTIETNDVTRLQKEVPFTIILPEYLPDGFKSYELVMTMHKIDQVVNLRIMYYYLTKAGEIQILESEPSDPYPRPLPPGLFAKMNPDYTPIDLGGMEVLENIGFDDIIWSGQKTRLSSLQYIWEQNNLHFSVDIIGYDQVESRKIIESMLK
jgi:hypothetical protein